MCAKFNLYEQQGSVSKYLFHVPSPPEARTAGSPASQQAEQAATLGWYQQPEARTDNNASTMSGCISE